MQMHDILDMHGRVALITGGHAWLGNDMACALAEYGCDIIITSREQARADAAAAKIADTYGVKALGLTLDQTDYTSVERMAQAAFAWQKRIDVLINNAGGGSGKGECAFLKRDPADIQNMINTNLMGALFCCRAVCGYMAQANSGVVINMASIAALVGRDRAMYHDSHKMEQPVEYAAAKGGIIGMTQDLAAYMAPYGVRVNCISPGLVQGPMMDATVEQLGQSFLEKEQPLYPLGFGKPQDVASMAAFMLSQEASWLTGQNIMLAGGR